MGLIKHRVERIARMKLTCHSFLASQTLVVPAFANTFRQQFSNGDRIFGLLGIDSLHGAVKAAQKLAMQS